MSYPMKEVKCDFGNSSPLYREMTPQEYEKSLNFYRLLIEAYSLSSVRLSREYGSYLKCWFSDQSCDGCENYEMRYRLHKLPMSFDDYCLQVI